MPQLFTYIDGCLATDYLRGKWVELRLVLRTIVHPITQYSIRHITHTYTHIHTHTIYKASLSVCLCNPTLPCLPRKPFLWPLEKMMKRCGRSVHAPLLVPLVTQLSRPLPRTHQRTEVLLGQVRLPQTRLSPSSTAVARRHALP